MWTRRKTDFLRRSTYGSFVALALVSAGALAGCGETDALGAVGPPLAQQRFLIEHNATDEDTGFQLFVDGEPWRKLEVSGPRGEVLAVEARGPLARFGLTEAFFETNEPEADEVPLQRILTRFPPGSYDFSAINAQNETRMRSTATLSHDIPAEPEITVPAEDAVVDTKDLRIAWNPVTETITGDPVDLVGYQVIVTREEEDEEPVAFHFESEMSVFVPASTTSITVPPEFLETGLEYEIEILAIEASGNQTIGAVTFRT